MPALLILAIIVAIFAFITWLVSFAVSNEPAKGEKVSTHETNRNGVRVLSLALWFIAGLMVLGSAYNSVGTKKVGVETSFGKTVGYLSNGPHMTAPWIKVHSMDAAIQTDDHLGNTAKGDTGCFNVRIANQQTGCAEVSMQWRINPTQVDYLYKNYRSFEHVKAQLVDRKLFNAVNEALATYNPQNDVSAGTVRNPLPRYQNAIFRLMKQKILTIDGKPLIEVLNVQLPIVHFDPETQSRINQLQQQVAQTRIAAQEQKTNAAKQRANSALAKRSLTPEVLQSRCYDILEKMVNQHEQVPAGFSCVGPSTVGVITGSK
jgi:hypothetical protein